MVIFNSYVSSPEGIYWFIIHKSKLIIQLLAASYRNKNPHRFPLSRFIWGNWQIVNWPNWITSIFNG